MKEFSENKNKVSKNFKSDIVKISGKVIFINPFLYWRRIDQNTNKWLREPGQISESEIISNRKRFYPELDWSNLSHEDRLIKDGAIEMFLKTLQLINNFHPYLNSENLIEVERKMLIAKTKSFEKWVFKSLKQKARLELKEKRKFLRDRFVRNWREWFSLESTQKAFLPVAIIICASAFVGWSAGISKNSCNPYFESSMNDEI